MSLAAAFATVRPDAARVADLEARLATLLAAGAAAWPGVALDGERFARQLASHVGAREAVDAALAAFHAADLYLAGAAAAGDAGAIAALETTFLAQVPVWLSRLSLPAVDVEEVAQRVRAKLLVAEPGAPPRIAEYAGRGPLGGWLRVITLHAALDLKRRRTPSPAREELQLASELGPEMEYLKRRYGAELQEVFDDAMGRLSQRQRNLLRLHYLDGLSTPQIGALFRMHRTSVRRMLNDTHEALVVAVQAGLRERLSISATEMESILRLAHSRLGIDLASYLTSGR
jgi:RNA polymerase sigma-70 factor (ECF subfamily)